MLIPRMRVIAGPNGSGKTTIFRKILEENKVNPGVFVNADEIEKQLAETNQFDFGEFQLAIENTVIKEFFKTSTFSPMKRNELDLWTKLEVKSNILYSTANIDSYLAADLAEFIRQQLLLKRVSFSYETVMSHPSKIDFMKQAREAGFRVYLYFVATEDAGINVNRVAIRVAQKGHKVDEPTIRSRYFKSIENLIPAVKASSRAYIFDNSQESANLIAEITDGEAVVINDVVAVPNWVKQYLESV